MSLSGNSENSMDQRIISAALNLFAYEGYDAVSVPRIADAAGVGIGSIYRMTASKSALASRVFEQVIEDLNRAVTLQQPEDNSQMAREAFFWVHWKQFSDWVLASPQFFRFGILYVFTGPGRGSPKLEDIALLRAILETAQAKGWLFTDDFGLLANLILGPAALLALRAKKDERIHEAALHKVGEAVLRALTPA